MSNVERIRKLEARLLEMERRTVPVWERPILEVARLALSQEIARLSRQVAQWDRLIYVPVPVRRS